jgi:hypothetical protein
MKKLIFVFAAFVSLSSCVKTIDPAFPEPVDVRLQKALTAYRTAMIQAPGWKMFVYPAGLQSQDIEVGGLTYYLKFPDSNRVNMVSDFRPDMAATPKESGYRIRADQRPTLVFDTYSYIHVAADPDPDVSGSPTATGGFGWGTDFEFEFTEAAPRDSLVMKGVFNNSEALMLPVTQEEIDAAFGGRLAEMVQNTRDFINSGPFLFFNAADNSDIEVSFNLFLFRINFNYLSDNSVITIGVPFSHTTEGVHFKNPVTVGGYTFQDLLWDDVLDLYYIETGSGRVNITTSTSAIIPFYAVLGRSITSITVPTTPLPGQSAEFASVYEQIKTNLKNSPYDLDLSDILFFFDAESSSLGLLVLVQQSGATFVLQYVYSYTINSSNIANFTRVGNNGNADLVTTEMAPFINRIDNDNFKMDFYTAVTPPLGEFVSQQNPGFSFTGNLQ